MNSGSTPITDKNQLLEDGSSVRIRLYKDGMEGAMGSLTMSCNIAKFGGVRFLQDVTAYQGSIAANPVEQSYFHLQLMDVEGATTCSAYFDVQIEYVAQFTEPRSVAPSLRQALDKLILSSIKDEVKSSACLCTPMRSR